MSFEELKVTRFFTALIIATLLFSVTISNFNFNVYAEEDAEDEYKQKDERGEYKDEKRKEYAEKLEERKKQAEENRKNVLKHTCQNLENIINLGKTNAHLVNVLNVVHQSLLAKKEHLILGWILVYLHYL